MKLFYDIPMVGKLLTICLCLLAPLTLLLYLSLGNINGQIEFSRFEAYGNAYLRPLSVILEHLPDASRDAADAVDKALDSLAEVQRQYGQQLQFTPEGLGKRNRAHLTPERAAEQWRAVQATPGSRPVLTGTVMGMIAHVGDTSNLILDPDLDSYYLMDLTLLALPQTQKRLGDILDDAAQTLTGGALDEAALRRFNTYAALLQQSDLDRVMASAETAVMEDPNFYGVSQGMAETVKGGLDAYVADTSVFIALLRDVAAGKDVDRETFLQAGEKARDRAFRFWDTVIREQDKLLGLRIDSLVADRTVLLVSTGASLLLAVLVVIVVARAINRPLRGLAEVARDVAAGEMGSRATVWGRDEVGRLAEAFNGLLEANGQALSTAMQAKGQADDEARRANACLLEAEQSRREAESAKMEGQRQAAEHLAEIVERLGQASLELSAQVDNSNENSIQQKERIVETATAIEQMNVSILEVARNASHASEQSQRAQERAAAGAGVVRDAVSAIGLLKGQSHSLKEKLQALDEQARGIGQIMEVISDIADQTNLLALNAAIEAARAGDAGRGFAVVADEVRKLAEKTMVATKEVGQAIGSIQAGTADTSAAMDSTAELVDQAVNLAESSGTTLQEIVGMSLAACEQVQAIATAAEEQSAVSEQITQSTEVVSRTAEDSAQSLSRSKRSMDALSMLSSDLQDIVRELRA